MRVRLRRISAALSRVGAPKIGGARAADAPAADAPPRGRTRRQSIAREVCVLSLALAGGALAGLGRPGIDLPWLTLSGLVVLFWLALRARSVAQALARAIAFGLGEFCVATLGTLSWGLVVPATLSAFGIATHHVPLALFGRRAWQAMHPRFAPLAVGVVMIGCEELTEFLGSPFKLAAVLVHSMPFGVGGARFFGASFVSGVLSGACFQCAVVACAPSVKPFARRIRGAVAPFVWAAAILCVFAAIARSAAPPPRRSLQVGIPQINAGSAYYRSRLIAPELRSRLQNQMRRSLEKLDAAELIVTTETYDGGFAMMFPDVRRVFAEHARARHQALLLASYLPRKSGKKSNAVAGFDQQGRLVGIHEKVYLAPFGESDLTPGTDFRPLPLFPTDSVGILICLESQIAAAPVALVRGGATLLAVTTSDVTFGSTVTVFEHLAMAELRAIETGRDVVWASNAGPSGVIDRWGRFSHGPFGSAASVQVSAVTYSGLTPYVRFRELLLALEGLLLIWAIGAIWKAPAELPLVSALPKMARPKLLLGLGLLAAAFFVAASPALVAVRQSSDQTLLAAVAQAVAPGPQLTAAKDPYAPFRTGPEGSSRGSVAYLLTYYGIDTQAAALLDDLPDHAPLQQAVTYLHHRHQLSLRTLDLTRESPPRLAWLATLTDGTVAVADFSGRGNVHVFVPRLGRVLAVPPERLTQLLQPEGFVPVFVDPMAVEPSEESGAR